jgi:hypothetical protein
MTPWKGKTVANCNRLQLKWQLCFLVLAILGALAHVLGWGNAFLYFALVCAVLSGRLGLAS